jgi:hypothetical protein
MTLSGVEGSKFKVQHEKFARLHYLIVLIIVSEIRL